MIDRVSPAYEWRRKFKGKAALLKSRMRIKERASKEHAARNIVYKRVMRGTMVRPAECGLCDVPCRPEAHHPDYTKPLEVLWLCKKCHVRLHTVIRRAKKSAAQLAIRKAEASPTRGV